jgi:hypothetical protein
MRTPVYLVEKSTGLKDENGVELYYTVAVKLTRGAADDLKDKTDECMRVRKLYATK